MHMGIEMPDINTSSVQHTMLYNTQKTKGRMANTAKDENIQRKDVTFQTTDYYWTYTRHMLV